jgi:5-methylthioadenosine/S-adenosylhomocysteine deaminase
MKILFKNARILTMVNDKIIEGHLVVTDNRISYIGNQLPAGFFDQVIDCEGNLIMPGFKNAHTHSAMTFLRSKADDQSLHDWLFNEIFPREANLHDGCIKELSKVAILEYLSSGITAVLDQYFFPQEFADTCTEFGFRSVSLGMYDKDARPVDEVLRLFRDNNKINSLATFVIGMHSEYTGTDEMFNATKVLLDKTNSPFYTHLSETISEVEDCKSRRGQTPMEFFDSLHFFDNGGAIFHGVYLSDNDIEIIKKHNVTVVSNPSSNMKLASGIAEIKKLLDRGVNVALGTDGPASNNALDMFREMYLVTGLQKLKNMDPISIPAYEVIKMATVNGAKAMGLEEADTLQVGKLADLIMIDLYRPSMQPINNIISNLVYSGEKDCVKLTMINGKILYRDGQFYVGEDIKEIYKKVQLLTEELNVIK